MNNRNDADVSLPIAHVQAFHDSIIQKRGMNKMFSHEQS
jgi:hypothetical protein